MIDTVFIYLKKLLLLTVAVMFAFVVVYTPQNYTTSTGKHSTVPTAHAQWAVFDAANSIQNTLTAIGTTAVQGFQSLVSNKEITLDAIAWAVAKQLISNMTSSIVDWINNGFEGRPAFVQDLDNWLLRSADEAVGEFINSIDGLGSFVCEPFRLNVQIAIALAWDFERENRAAVECTLTDVIDNFEGFLGGDFIHGGRGSDWEGWFELITEPNSTPYGATLSAGAEMRARAINARGEQATLLEFGNGFLSYQKCDTVSGPTGGEERCYIVTPGEVISASINKSLGAGQDVLVEADEINEIIGALVNQLASRVFEGAYGLLGMGNSSGSYSPYSRSRFSDDIRDGRIDDPTNLGGTTGAGGESGDGFGAVQYSVEMEATLAFQAEALNTLRTYRGYFTTALSNTSAEQQTIIQSYITTIDNFIDRVTQAQIAGLPILDETKLREEAFALASNAERPDILNQILELVTDFYGLNFISELELNALIQSWDTALGQFGNGLSFGNPTTSNVTLPACTAAGPNETLIRNSQYRTWESVFGRFGSPGNSTRLKMGRTNYLNLQFTAPENFDEFDQARIKWVGDPEEAGSVRVALQNCLGAPSEERALSQNCFLHKGPPAGNFSIGFGGNPKLTCTAEPGETYVLSVAFLQQDDGLSCEDASCAWFVEEE